MAGLKSHTQFLLLVALQVIYFFSLSQGSIQCICTTLECESEGVSVCQSEHMCYVQNMEQEAPSNPGLKKGVIRGCIDDRTPLLCENRARPQGYTGPWPLLHCCKEEWCNKDIVPTIPTPWLQEQNKHSDESGNLADAAGADLYSAVKDKFGTEDGPYHQQNNEAQYDQGSYKEDTPPGAKIYRPRQKQRSKTINPLYIAVPVAGACVLLAIIIFAIYILKRQNAMLAEYHQQHLKQQKMCTPIYNGHAKLAPSFNHYPPHHPITAQQQKLISSPSSSLPTSDSPCQDLLTVENNKHKLYSDSASERSSTGSETKLLMKV